MRGFPHSGSALCGVLALLGCADDHSSGASEDSGGSTSSSGGSTSSSGGATMSSAGSGGTGGPSSSGGSSGSGGVHASGGSTNGTGGASGSHGSGAAGGASGSDAGTGGATSSDASAEGGTTDPCGTSLFCEKFDGYDTVKSITDKQKFGPWRASLTTGATMALDGTHASSGTLALHVHLDAAVTAGGRLFADGMQPIFASHPTHVYGRMMMYIDSNGTSEHWTFFGVNGNAEPGSPASAATRSTS